MTSPEMTKAQAAAIVLLAKGGAYRSIKAVGGPVVSDEGKMIAATANALVRNGWAVWGPEENEQKELRLTDAGDAQLPAGYRAWRARIESGDTEEDEQRLKLSGWAPVQGFPKRVMDPLQVRCIRCGAEREIVLGRIALDGAAPRACYHTGREARHLTLEERQELRAIRKRLIEARVRSEM